MTVLVVLLTIAVGLLAVLVAGLLRSHAEILRILHHLGADYMSGEIELSPARAPARPLGNAPDLAGVTPLGDALVVGLSNPEVSALLLFLSSGCEKCVRFFSSIASGEHRSLGTRVIVVTRGPEQESPAELRGWVERGVEIVMSSAAWDDFRTPGAPYVVFCTSGQVVGEGTAGSWEQIASLLKQARSDGTAASTPARDSRDAAIERAREVARQKANDAARERRNDDELRAAGLEPGDPRLYPRRPDEAA